ncbi:MAG: glucosamine-6-phosphate deaminase [Oscillospiraceae bacterium]|jgi:glucosamine-6-phosphate deaminase|nr:glucosamine-6-phosphate deaminase [Oscillospiraceae bacterium]
MDIRILNNAQEIAQAVGDIFSAQLKEQPRSILGLATGASPVPTYQYLIDLYKKGKISFKDVKTFNLDEYCDLPREDRNSYYSFMFENLFSHVDILPENVNILDGNAVDVDAECAGFDARIEKMGGIDIQLLGIGTNGHIGFNEPAEAFTEGTFKVKLTNSTIQSNKIYFPDGHMPRYALTMGIGSIMKAKKIILIATGEAKAQAVKAMAKGEVAPACPASVLQNHADAVIFLDKAAASLL